MGYRFTLVLSREVTAEESALLEEVGCAGAVFGSDSLPTNAEIPVTKMDFDVTSSPSLAAAIESALAAVKKVPDLSVPGLTVPAQPAHPQTADQPDASDGVNAGTVVEGTVVDDEPVAEKAAAKRPAAKKPAAKEPVKKLAVKKLAVKEPAAKKAAQEAVRADSAAGPVEAAAGTS
jgi:hypothetical protein